MNNRIEKAKYALVWYMKRALEKNGMAFDSENEAEVRTIIDDIVAGILEEIKKGE